MKYHSLSQTEYLNIDGELILQGRPVLSEDNHTKDVWYVVWITAGIINKKGLGYYFDD